MSEATDKWESAVRAENARWIDRCVNSHDALVAACKALLWNLQVICTIPTSEHPAQETREHFEGTTVIKEARAALALAEKDGGE